MDYQYLDIKRQDHVLTCTMSNPPTHTMVADEAYELYQLVEEVEKDSNVRVLVFTGGGEDVFIRHYEVGELSAASEAAQNDKPRTPQKPRPGLREVILKIESLNAITIAAINGSTMGGGLEFALGCDFRLQRQGEYYIGLPETNVGILPGGGGTQRLARLIGMAKTLDLILLGQIYGPDQALELGVVSRVFSQDNFMAEVDEFAQLLAKRAPLALANAKRAIREGAKLSLEDGLKREAELFAELIASEDAAKAMKATLKGEPIPDFKGR